MADQDIDKESRTEDPTERRLEEAREKGQVPSSREVGTALLFVAATLVFLFQGHALWTALQVKMRFLLSGAIQGDLTQLGVVVLLREMTVGVILDLAPLFLVLVLVALISSPLQHGWIFSWEPVKPRFSKISPLAGFKRLFSMRALVEFLKALIKMIVVGVAVWLGIKDSSEEVLILADTSMVDVVGRMGEDVIAIMWRVAAAFLLLAILDFMYQKWEYTKNLRMTRQEVRDELKQLEGDPQVKARIRQIQRQMAQRRMMQEVPRADVVITNPTHFAVALRYTPGEMAAPTLVAKGRGDVALRIRALAEEHGVPLVENPPLARTLYQDVELDRAIPSELFKAVAEVLAYVYRLKGKRPQPAAAPRAGGGGRAPGVSGDSRAPPQGRGPRPPSADGPGDGA